MGLMQGPVMPMSAPERIKLDWADVETVDIGNINGVLSKNLDALTLGSNTVLRIEDGSADCGDVIVEARTWSNFWDSPPDGTNDDGDDGDFYFDQEGLYLYKASGGSSGCGGDNFFYSSMEANGEDRDPSTGFRYGNSYKVGFEPGDAYTPFSRYLFNFHQHGTLDERVAITDISKSGNTYSFDIWEDFLTEDGQGAKLLSTNYAFDDETVARNASTSWDLGGNFQLYGDPELSAGTTLSFSSGSELKVYGTLNAEDVTLTASGTSWDGLYFAYGSDGTLDGVTVDKASGDAITIYNASPTIENSTITVSGSNKRAFNIIGSSATPVIHDNTNIQSDPYHTIYVYGWAAPRIYENEDLRNASSGSYAVVYAN